jgi:hypothetical protein
VSTPFRPIEIPPGVVATATKKMRSSNWAEVNLMRWVEGQMAPVGGQSRYDYPPFASRCRAVHSWFSLDENHFIAYLCERNIYVDDGDSLREITPIGGLEPELSPTVGGYGDGPYNEGIEIAATAPFAAGTFTITVTPNPGWVQPGVHVFNMTRGPPDDPPLVGIVASYVDTALTLVNAAPLGSVGPNDILMFGAYSEQRGAGTIPIDALPNAWTLSNFGQILLAMTSSDGRLLEWDPTALGTVMTEVTSDDTGTGFAPHGRLFVVTQERFVQIFGMINDGTGGGSFRRFGWCDQENYHSWDFSDITSQAGFLDIEPASPIVSAEATRNGTLFFTAHKAYSSTWLGIPYVYNYLELAQNCTPWSPESIVATSSMTLWMSQQGMFSFDGTTVLPIACKVRPWVDDDIDPVNVREQACAVHVGNFNEYWWFFPQLGQPYNTRCIIYNYREGWWSQGEMSRSAGITASFTAQTIMADGLVAFEHELGTTYGNADLPWAETFDLNLTNGSQLITVKQMMPDVDGDRENLRYSLFYRNSRSKGDPELQSPLKTVRGDGYVDFRTTGRDIRLRIDVAATPVLAFTLGQHLVDAVPRGDR